MSQIVSTGVTGLPSDMKALSQIGISTEREGTLSLDVGKLQDALDENLEGVTNLFVKGETTEGIAEQFYQFAFGATRSGDGDLAIRVDGLQDRVRKLNAKIEVQEAALERMEGPAQGSLCRLGEPDWLCPVHESICFVFLVSR